MKSKKRNNEEFSFFDEDLDDNSNENDDENNEHKEHTEEDFNSLIKNTIKQRKKLKEKQNGTADIRSFVNSKAPPQRQNSNPNLSFKKIEMPTFLFKSQNPNYDIYNKSNELENVDDEDNEDLFLKFKREREEKLKKSKMDHFLDGNSKSGPSVNSNSIKKEKKQPNKKKTDNEEFDFGLNDLLYDKNKTINNDNYTNNNNNNTIFNINNNNNINNNKTYNKNNNNTDDVFNITFKKSSNIDTTSYIKNQTTNITSTNSKRNSNQIIIEESDEDDFENNYNSLTLSQGSDNIKRSNSSNESEFSYHFNKYIKETNNNNNNSNNNNYNNSNNNYNIQKQMEKVNNLKTIVDDYEKLYKEKYLELQKEIKILNNFLDSNNKN
ncbi:hypothetical protein DICPUDRAFT_78662 [Dictyostelium purpureum]|uniref:Uncharacterized protein n=1 Tax=Dictyostelium purpureum TaxID=5786 RepID=F0ZK65_DICPU|nr:uncharacterized protein DICPUDRAFT_78662 [Dictyostelium purpureum]EGC35668.1 hypothetical protein DICPUDRAFT_78662 [Dictyostelium purpureum]|eukprot:XP_003287801.1 hypothetical protein DICPUDRAFT_78662 [Dictyostelium purpureum]